MFTPIYASRSRLIPSVNAIIYGFSRKTWVLGVFKIFKALVEKESGLKINAMKSNQGGEFTLREFDKFCEDNGIFQPLHVSRFP